jgi:hypothetical protein
MLVTPIIYRSRRLYAFQSTISSARTIMENLPLSRNSVDLPLSV